MNIGDPIYEVTDNELILGQIIKVNGENDCTGHVTAIIPKEAFVAAYNKWIKGNKKSVTKFFRRHF